MVKRDIPNDDGLKELLGRHLERDSAVCEAIPGPDIYESLVNLNLKVDEMLHSQHSW